MDEIAAIAAALCEADAKCRWYVGTPNQEFLGELFAERQRLLDLLLTTGNALLGPYEWQRIIVPEMA